MRFYIKEQNKEIYYDDQMRFLWLQYGHEPDEEQQAVCEKEVK